MDKAASDRIAELEAEGDAKDEEIAVLESELADCYRLINEMGEGIKMRDAQIMAYQRGQRVEYEVA